MFEAARRSLDLAYERLRLRAFRDRHARQRCFVIGDGPSLREQALARLRGEAIFVTNNFVLHPEFTAISPTYYCVSDPDFFLVDRERDARALVLRERASAIDKFFPYSVKPVVRKERLLHGRSTYYLVEFDDEDVAVWKSGSMSLDPTRGVQMSDTVIVDFCLPLAFYMGFTEVYLLGCDTDYRLDHADDYSLGHFYDHKEPVNPVVREFHRTTWFDHVTRSYQVAHRLFEARGRHIRNATRGGKLEVFPRVDLDDLL